MLDRSLRPCSLALLMALCLATTTACGGNNDTPEPEPEPDLYPDLEEAEPLTLDSVELGIGLHHGEALALANNKGENLEEARGVFSHANLQVQAYDELTHQFGEYTYFRIDGGENPRGAIEFIQTPAAGEVAVRTADLKDEATSALGRVGADDFESVSVTVDFWRTNREWYVRWDGLLGDDANTVGIGPYGFGREEMVDDLLDEITDIARQNEPKYMVIGSEMELLWAQEMMTPGIAIGEWSGFLSFYQDAVDRIKEVSPNTKVGVGINWDRFVTEVVPAYIILETQGQEFDEPLELDEQIDRAFRALILPTLVWGDTLTLMSYVAPGNEDAALYYQWLRRLPDLYEIDPEIVYYSVGSPISNSAANQAQRNYMVNFLEWNAGVNVGAIYWERLMNIDGSNGANQQIDGRCKALVEDADKNFLLPRERCFDGLFDSVFQIKPIMSGLKNNFE